MIEFKEFNNIYIGLAVLLLWILLAVFYLFRRQRAIKEFDPYKNVFVSRSTNMYITSILLMVLALALLTTALMRPQTRSSLKKVKVHTMNIVFCLDVSKSMYAKDTPPHRLERAKEFIRRIVSQFRGDKVALIVFSGEAMIQCPSTDDYNTFFNLLQFADSRNIGRPGTNIAAAIKAAVEYKQKHFLKDVVVVLLSDGENFEGDVDKVLSEAKKEGVTIYTVGVGTPNGEPIPVLNDKGQVVGYKKDKYGNIVVSKLNSALLRKIAEETGGKYYELKRGSSDEIRLINELTRLKGQQETEVKRYEYEEQYHIFVVLALFLLMIDWLLPLFYRLRGYRAILVLLLVMPIIFGFSSSYINEGNKAYKSGDYYKAQENYAQALRGDTTNAVALFNLGAALYKAHMYDTAVMSFGAVREKDPHKQAEVFYNIGNCYFKKGEYNKALQSYIKSLMLNPSDTAAKYNLEVTLRKLKLAKSNKKQSSSKQEKNKKKEQKAKTQEAIKRMLDNYDKKQKLKKLKKSRRAKVEYDW